MPHANRRRGRIALLACLMSIAAWSLFPARCAAEQVDEYQAKAAFILNFAKFVVWPQGPMKAPADRFSICILGDDPFHGAIEQAIAGKKLDGRDLELRQVADANAAHTCQILFISASGRKKFRAVVEDLKGNGVLTIGDVPGIAAEGAVIDFKLQAGRIRFEINLEAAEQQQLRISSKLLSLAEIVKTR